MKKLLLTLLPALLLCSGCGLRADHPPLEAIEAVETMGVDLRDGTRVSVTTGGGKDAERIGETGPTLPLALDALRDRSLHGGLFYGHTQYLLLGEDYARAGVQTLLDYTARSAELRVATPVYVMRGEAADAVLAEELDVTAQLTALARGGLPSATVTELSDRLACAGCALIGAVRYDPDAHALAPDGCAVLKGGRLIGFLDEEGAQAAAWVTGADGGSIALDAGTTFSLTRCAVHCAAEWSDGRPSSLTVSVAAEAAAQTLPEGTRITNEAVRAALETRLAQAVAQRMANTVGQTQALGADALDLGGLLAGAHPLQWARCADGWAALYPALPVTVHAAVRITGTQDLTDPLPEEGDA